MSFILRAIFGVITFGGTAVAPAMARRAIKAVESHGEAGKLVGAVARQVLPISSKREVETKKSANIQKTLKELQAKKCDLLQNPENKEYWFDALYACGENKKERVDFYYVSSEDSHNTDSSSYLKKVSNVDYLERKEDEAAQLTLNLENNEVVSWKVAFESGWKHFKNVNLSNQCKISTKELGGNDLRCVLKETDNTHSVYNFSIF